MSDDVNRLREPSSRLLERELFVCSASELVLLQRLGDPSSGDAFATGPPRLVWDLEWPCGLVASLEFDQLSQRLTGHLDRPEVEHAFRHLGIEPLDLWLLETEVPTKFAAQCAPPEKSFELWRQDEHGSKAMVRQGLTEGDATCWRDQLESGGHKQHYWVQRSRLEGSVEGSGEEGETEVRQQLIDRLTRSRSGNTEE